MSLRICLVGSRFRILSRSTDFSFLWLIARSLTKRGHDVTVISNRSPLGKSEIIRDGVKAYYLLEGVARSNSTNFAQAAYHKFIQLHREEKFDLVHSLDASGVIIAQHKKALQVATAFDANATQMNELFGIMAQNQETVASIVATYISIAIKYLKTYFSSDRKILKTADGVFVNNPLQRIFLERYYYYPDLKIYSVPYGAEVGDLSAKEHTEEVRKNYQIPKHAQVAVTISDMTDVAELMPLLKAFEKVAIKKSQAYLVILGHGPKFKQVEYEVLSRALGSRVLLPGEVRGQDLQEAVLLGDVFIELSSRSTGLDSGLIEAMAQKKIIIGSEVSSISNLIEDGTDGFLIRPADTDSLTNLLVEIFSGNLACEEMGEKARQKVLNLFDPSKMVSKIEESYSKILAKSL